MQSGDIFEQAIANSSPYHGKVAIISTLWNAKLVDQMVEDARTILLENLQNPHIEEYKVAGTIELAHAAATLMRGDTLFAGIIIIGAVIRGETPHFDYVCQNISTATALLNTKSDSVTPIIFGVLTVDNLVQAEERVYGKNGHQKKGELDAKSLLIQSNFLQNGRRHTSD